MNKIYPWLADALLLGGSAGLSYGAWLAWAPAGFMVGGALLIIAGVMIARMN
ncbi:MAG: hypothetical protein NUV51_04750 [Sulfuricaulis sp.]|nr:hypothetical protein [Sulfuricaulis sp.]